MKQLKKIDPFIGKILVDARRIFVEADDEEFCVGIELTFTSGQLLIRALSETDTLSVEHVLSNSEEIESWERRSLKRSTCFYKYKGQLLVNAWVCFGSENYCDAIDFGFGDLNLPNVKVLSLTSEVIELAVSPLFDDAIDSIQH